MPRETEHVLADHLRLVLNGEVDADIERNYAQDAVLVTDFGTFRGKEGLREAIPRLHGHLDGAGLSCSRGVADGEVASVRWERRDASGPCAADSYLVRDGLIRVRSIHLSGRGEEAHP